jgi:hypothetical protein
MISKCLRELEGAGWISLKRRFNATTVYTLNFPSSGARYEEAHERKYGDRYEGKYENERTDTEEYLDESDLDVVEYDESYFEDDELPF